MKSLISNVNSVLQIKPISWTSSRTQSYRSPNTTPTLSPTTCKCIEAREQTLICTFKSFPIGSLCPAAYLSNSKHIFPNKFIYSNNQNHKGLLSFLPIAPSNHFRLTASEVHHIASRSELPAFITSLCSPYRKKFLLHNGFIFISCPQPLCVQCVTLGHRGEKKQQLISDPVMALDTLLKLFIPR